jgi:hypothetical protein
VYVGTFVEDRGLVLRSRCWRALAVRTHSPSILFPGVPNLHP